MELQLLAQVVLGQERIHEMKKTDIKRKAKSTIRVDSESFVLGFPTPISDVLRKKKKIKKNDKDNKSTNTGPRIK